VSYVLVVNPNLGRHQPRWPHQGDEGDSGEFNYASAGVGSARTWPWTVPACRECQGDARPHQGARRRSPVWLRGDTQLAIDTSRRCRGSRAGKLRALGADGQVALRTFARRADICRSGAAAVRCDRAWGFARTDRVPAPIVAKVNDALVRAVNDSATAGIAAGGQGIAPEPGSAQQFGAVLASETERLSKLIDDAKIHHTLSGVRAHATTWMR